jgi:hypothetical protein
MKPKRKTKTIVRAPNTDAMLEKAQASAAQQVKQHIANAQRAIGKLQRSLSDAWSLTEFLAPLPNVVPMRKKKAGSK